MAARGERQVAFITKAFCVLSVRRQHFVQDLGHCPRLLFRAFSSDRLTGSQARCRATLIPTKSLYRAIPFWFHRPVPNQRATSAGLLGESADCSDMATSY